MLALTSRNDVHHSVNLSNTKFITYIYTSFYHFFSEKNNTQTSLFEYFKNVNSNLPPWVFFADELVRRFTQTKIIRRTTKNTVLVLCFVTVLRHIVNRSYLLNTVQHSYMIKVFLSINEEETKPCWNTLYCKAQLCVTKLFTLFQFSSQKS